MAGNNLPEEINERLRGPYSANAALATATRQGLFNLKADRPLSSRQDFDPYNTRYRVNGGSIARLQGTYELTTDGAQTGSEAVLESSRLGVYRAGVENEAALGVWLDERPTGDGEVRIGYTDERLSDGVAHVITSDDYLIRFQNRNQEDVEVSRSAGEWKRGVVTEHTDSNGDLLGKSYGLDPLQGNNNSQTEWVPEYGYVYGLTLGWYGPLSTMAWMDAVAHQNGVWGQRRIPLVLYRPVEEPAFEVPNRPLHLSVRNGTTAESVTARVAGRQFTTQGDVRPSPEPSWKEATGQSLPMDGTGVGPKDWYVIAVIRRKPGDEGVAVGLDELEVSAPNESLALSSRVVDPSYLSGVSYEGPDDLSAGQTALEFDLATDTPSRVSLETWTDANDADKTKPQGVGYRGDHVGTGAKNTATTGDLTGDLTFPFVRDWPTVFLARTRSGTSDTVDTIAKMIEVGS